MRRRVLLPLHRLHSAISLKNPHHTKRRRRASSRRTSRAAYHSVNGFFLRSIGRLDEDRHHDDQQRLDKLPDLHVNARACIYLFTVWFWLKSILYVNLCSVNGAIANIQIIPKDLATVPKLIAIVSSSIPRNRFHSARRFSISGNCSPQFIVFINRKSPINEMLPKTIVQNHRHANSQLKS